jgi:hypothetical protein
MYKLCQHGCCQCECQGPAWHDFVVNCALILLRLLQSFTINYDIMVMACLQGTCQLHSYTRLFQGEPVIGANKPIPSNPILSQKSKQLCIETTWTVLCTYYHKRGWSSFFSPTWLLVVMSLKGRCWYPLTTKAHATHPTGRPWSWVLKQDNNWPIPCGLSDGQKC